jgi:hypothetical protein
MSAAAILERLHRDGLQVRTDGERVLLSPREKVTAQVVEVVRQHKPALLEALAAPTRPAPHPELERRRALIERDLAEHPDKRVAFDVADAPLRPEPGEPVSVVLAFRTPVGIVSGELHVPRERFEPVLFIRTLEETSRRPA